MGQDGTVNTNTFIHTSCNIPFAQFTHISSQYPICFIYTHISQYPMIHFIYIYTHTHVYSFIADTKYRSIRHAEAGGKIVKQRNHTHLTISHLLHIHTYLAISHSQYFVPLYSCTQKNDISPRFKKFFLLLDFFFDTFTNTSYV